MAYDEGKWRLLNPLSVRFSQPRIAPHFRDGHLLDETWLEVHDTPLISPTDPAGGNAAPPYDAILMTPFPAIRVISWLPKLRRPDGEAERDEYGDHILGRRAWFALDNRRLHSMQRAAAQRWPRRCCAVVRCIEEVPGTTIRELRKFRTTTQGKSVEVGVRAGDTEPWCWMQDAPPSARDVFLAGGEGGLDTEPEGLFAEDLWDATEWAPHAVAAAAAARPPREERRPKATTALEDQYKSVESKAQTVNGGGCAAQQHKQRGEQQRQQPHSQPRELGGSAAAEQAKTCASKRRSSACPSSGWEYVDPSGKLQGPFGLDRMRLWHQRGFFYPALPMRCDASDQFVPFSELWAPGVLPFTTEVLHFGSS